MVTLGSVLFFAASAFVSGKGVYRVTLSKHEKSYDDWTSHLLARRQVMMAKATNHTMPIHNWKDVAYTGSIMIGTPGTLEEVIFDTGSSNMWVPSRQCKGCTKKHLYDHRRSSTYKANGHPIDLGYGAGQVSGYVSCDDVTWAGLALKGFPFAEINNLDLGRAYIEGPLDGILGLGFSSMSVDGILTPLEALNQSGQLAEPIFAFYLGGGSKGGKSELVFGGVDHSHYTGNFMYVDLIDETETSWEVQMKDVKVNSKPILGDFSSYPVAMVDSGNTMITGPELFVSVMMEKLGARENKDVNLYSVPCSTVATSKVTFTLGGSVDGYDFDFSVEDLVYARDGDHCYLGVQTNLARKFILGDIFMRKYYVQFDYGKKRMGFAKAVNTAKQPIIV